MKKKKKQDSTGIELCRFIYYTGELYRRYIIMGITQLQSRLALRSPRRRPDIPIMVELFSNSDDGNYCLTQNYSDRSYI